MKSQSLTVPKVSEIKRQWVEIDASAQPLGRLASHIAHILRGKHKRTFTPHQDAGDFVVATNVEHLKFTGRKIDQKTYYRHSGFLGGLKSRKLKDELAKHPDQVLKHAVLNMLDDVRFRKKLVSRLKMVKGTQHNFKIDRKVS